MPTPVIKTLITLALPCLVLSSIAQNGPIYETLSNAQGLSQGMVFDILQDREGFIWIATKNGLNRHDGYGFKVFSNDPYNSHSLSSNSIVELFEDSRGRIWVGTEDAGLNVYDKNDGRFYRIAHAASDNSTLSGNRIRLIEELRDGRMLVAAEGAGFNIIALDNDFFKRGAPPVITRMTLPYGTQVYEMGKDRHGTMWIGGMDGAVYRFDASNNSFHPLKNGQILYNGHFTRDSNILINRNLFLTDGKNVVPLFDTATTMVGNIVFRPREKPWEYHHRELRFYDVSKWEPGKPVSWTEQLPAEKRLLYPFIVDRSGLVWTGTVGYGLRKYNTGGTLFKTSLPGYSVRWIVPAGPDEFFLGDFAYGWKKWKNGQIENNALEKIPAITQVDNFIISKTGDYWIKSDNKGFVKYSPFSGEVKQYPGINSYNSIGAKQPLLEDSKGNTWFPGLGGWFTVLNTRTGKIDSFNINTNKGRLLSPRAVCTALYEDGEGVYWIGTQEGFARVVLLNVPGAKPQVKWYYNDSKSRNSLNYNHVSCFLDDPAEPGLYLWICAKGGGLNRLNKRTGDFFHLTAKNGLPDDVVYGILPDDAGNIWGSTNNGIFCLLANATKDSSKWVFRNFTRAHGLQDNEFNTGAYKRLPGGNLAFGGVNGLNVFDPKEVLAVGFTPNVFITDILVSNVSVMPGDKTGVLQNTIEKTTGITLNHLQDIVTLEFASLDFTAPAQNKYRYQLVGIDEHWVESGTRRSATYLHLPPGNFTFRVQGSNSQGIWSDKIAELKIAVLPPWWRTTWAYACYIVLALLAGSAWARFRVNRARLKSQLIFEQLEARRVKELDTVKTQLYTNITHEFRTPITVILGMAQHVIDKPEEHFTNGMSMILRNGRHLLNLVNEMLDLSKLESGKMTLQPVNGNVVKFLGYIVDSFHSLALSQHKQLHFLTGIEALHVAYDPERLRQIVANLLSNALKFTPENGHVYVGVNVNATRPTDAWVSLIISVRDTGAGIPPQQLPHIFDRFYQVDNSHTRKAEGTGIGLALTKELVKLMGGEIAVKSPPPGARKGSEFIVMLPLMKAPVTEDYTGYAIPQAYDVAPSTDSVAALIQKANENQPGEQPLILLVEDNVDVVAYTASCLPDYRLAVAQDGQEGFDIAQDLIPDLIIADVMMPVMDGFELCRRLRHDERTSHIPIIFLTAKADLESKLEGLQQGADAYLKKPFHREELLVRVKKLLELRQSLQAYYLRKAGIGNDQQPASLPAVPPAAAAKLEDAFVTKVRLAIEANLSNADFTVADLCKLVFISHSQLHRKLEALTGCAPNKFIRIIRLNKAKELLTNDLESIGSIALDCGFNDPGYFARVFKQEYGVTPQEWRGSGKGVASVRG